MENQMNYQDGKRTENLSDLFELVGIKGILKVPAYQRAYAWEEKQLKEFVGDMLEMKERGNYYYGHFILEKTTEGYEIIDGQQRLTTFVLFLMVCQLFSGEDYSRCINKFKTVDYDDTAFDSLKETGKLNLNQKEWNADALGLGTKEQTISLQRILFALEFFRKFLTDKESELNSNFTTEIDRYVRILLVAQVSTHITESKAVAVQIFELQNTRGIQLNLIEKVKSKLMKTVYLQGDENEKDGAVSEIQSNFANIYKLEENVAASAFRGKLSLGNILLHHLRIVDDGDKIETPEEGKFRTPHVSANEEQILNYLDEKLKTGAAAYAKRLSEKFLKTVLLICEELPDWDKKIPLIGDVLILDRSLSLEFFLVLYHKACKSEIQNEPFLLKWERFLLIRDFHNEYYRQKYRDNFAKLFYELANSENVTVVLDSFLETGFRKDLMIDFNLHLTVKKHINDHESHIKNNINFWKDKFIYFLYKYELSIGADISQMRKIMKDGASIEHILPNEWDWSWINENDIDNISEEGKEFNEKIRAVINGPGNIILIPLSENQSLSNTRPSEKCYTSCTGGSYELHNANQRLWEDSKKWTDIIQNRGKVIYDFMVKFIS